jgi:hypothetical protein
MYLVSIRKRLLKSQNFSFGLQTMRFLESKALALEVFLDGHYLETKFFEKLCRGAGPLR